MSKYFFDCEFIEGFKKPISWLPTIGNFNKPYHSIQLISIGIVAEDGRIYYAISNEFNPKDANQWVKDNVLRPMFTELYQTESTYAKTYFPNSLTDKNLLKWRGKSNKQIAKEIQGFVFNVDNPHRYTETALQSNIDKVSPIEFYAYYADYDHVCLSSLYGSMVNQPSGFPMYTKDIQQIIDVNKIDKYLLLKEIPQTNCHNALQDAIWNKNAYDWIIKNYPLSCGQ